MKKAMVVLCIILLSASPIVGQLGDTKSTYNYKDHFRINTPLSYLTPTFGDIQFKEKIKHYVLTADVEPHFFIFMEDNTSFAIDFFARFIVRIQTGTSLPVRTPSYMPGSTLYLKSNFFEKPFDYFTLNFTHHSNGQDGCPLNNTQPNANNDCFPNSNGGDRKVFNQYNGNFSTNFLELGYNLSFQKLNDTTKTLGYYLFKQDISKFIGDKYDYIYIGFQNHFTGIEPELIGRYGLQKIKIKYQRITSANWLFSEVKKFEADRFIAELNFNISSMNRLESFKFINRFNIDLKYNFTVMALKTNSTSLFVMAGYKGQDDYNIYLEDHFFYFGFGLSAGSIVYSR